MRERPSERLLQMFPDARSLALYRCAVADQWRAETAIDWSALSFDHLSPVVRKAMGAIYGDILFAEAFGVAVTARMAELAPEAWQRKFALIQAVDESRHAEFFERLVAKLAIHTEPSNELVLLREHFDQAADYDELMLHGQVIETAARVLFIRNGTRALELMAKAVRLPGAAAVSTVVRAIVDLVGRDESRHIAFGTHSLRRRLVGYDAASRDELEQRATASAHLIYRAFARRSNELAVLGSPPRDVLDRTWQALRVQLARLELDVGDAEPLSRFQSKCS